ncbi:MAG: hypothetical protein ACLGIZ_02450 [Acidimicrobiia bacterium]
MATTDAAARAHHRAPGGQISMPSKEGMEATSGEPLPVPARNSAPAATARRPAQPIRPLPARRASADLLAVKARRRRYQQILPPRAGERGW